MPALSNIKHERFAQALASGKSATDAHENAGYCRNDGNASKLAARPEIQARVKEITGAGARRAEVTVASLIEEAEEARVLAMERGQVSAAVAAIREKGVLSGQRVERSERGQPGEFDGASKDELRRYIETEAAALGITQAGKPH